MAERPPGPLGRRPLNAAFGDNTGDTFGYSTKRAFAKWLRNWWARTRRHQDF